MTTPHAKDDEPSSGEKALSVYLGLGANLGDREANLREAIERIKSLGLEIVRASSIYETEPIGYEGQPWFLNQVIEARMPIDLRFNTHDELRAQPDSLDVDSRSSAELQPAEIQIEELLYALLRIEREMGRRRLILNGPRVIDIDILLCGEMNRIFRDTRDDKDNTLDKGNTLIEAAPHLIIPHPRLHLRRFVLAPLCEIAPDLEHPALKKSCSEMLAALDDASIVRLYRSAG